MRFLLVSTSCLSVAFPRLVKHVDDSFLAAVTKLYNNAIPEDAQVLDLMSSWVSHLPTDRRYKKVVGHGMNTVEVQLCPSSTLHQLVQYHIMRDIVSRKLSSL